MRRTTFGVVASLGFLATSGALALTLPATWASLFGLPTRDARALAFVRVAGARELVLVLIAVTLLRRGLPGVAAVTIGCSSLIGVADFTVTCRLRGSAAIINLAIHLAGIVGLSFVWLRLRESA